MTIAEQVKDDLENGRFRLTVHAQRRLHERKLELIDIVQCASSAPRAIEQAHGTYLLEGTDLEGRAMQVIADWIDGVVVVTVIGGDEDEKMER